MVSCLGLAKFSFGWVGFRFFSSERYFAVSVYLRVSYGCVGFRLFKGLD